MTGLSDLKSALLDLGMEDLIALPETLHAPETAVLGHRPTQAEAVARALVSLLESGHILVWGGRWQDEPEPVNQQSAVKLLEDTSQYEFDSPTDRERRVFFVNVENPPAERTYKLRTVL